MPKTREQIKHDPVSAERWRDNRTGVMWFDPRKIKPLGEHILVELDIDKAGVASAIVRPDSSEAEIGSRTGTVIAVGPGKLTEKRQNSESWMLNPLVRRPLTVKIGDRVIIGHYSDWESWNCSADGHEGQDKNIVLCQEADVRGTL